MKNAHMREEILRVGDQLGFKKIGFLAVQSLDSWEDAVASRKKFDPSTAAIWNKLSITSSPLTLMTEAKTIITTAYPYIPHASETNDDDIGAYSTHYYAYPLGRKAIQELSVVLVSHQCKVLIDPPLPVKEIAYLSGLGYYGKNGLIHHPQFGSWMSLHVILTDVVFPYDVPLGPISDCGQCVRCVQACPTNAITDDGMVLISRCLRHYMLSSEIIPREYRDKMGMRILGCNACQDCCPKNAHIIQHGVMTDNMNVFNIRDILSQYDEGLKEMMKSIGSVVGFNYAKPQKILSMAVIAAGNTKDLTFIPLLAKTLKHNHPPIRAHSAWALGKLGGQESLLYLEEARDKENNHGVLDDIYHALMHIKR